MKDISKAFKIAILLASAVAIIGLFPPWAIARGFGITANAFSFRYSPIGIIIIICAIVTIVPTAISLISDKKWLRIITAILGILGSLVSLFMLIFCWSDSLPELVTFGPGILLTTIGSAIAFICSICLLAFKSKTTTKKTTSRKKK